MYGRVKLTSTSTLLSSPLIPISPYLHLPPLTRPLCFLPCYFPASPHAPTPLKFLCSHHRQPSKCTECKDAGVRAAVDQVNTRAKKTKKKTTKAAPSMTTKTPTPPTMADAGGIALSLADALEAAAAPTPMLCAGGVTLPVVAHPSMNPSDLPHILVGGITMASAGSESMKPQSVQLLVDGTLFKDAYIRTNKVGGQKHLRCFPSCNSNGHNDLGFCGHPIRVQVRSLAGGFPLQQSGVHVFAQFVDHAQRSAPIKKKGAVVDDVQRVDYEVGDEVTLATLRSVCRSLVDPSKPLMSGKLLDAHKRTGGGALTFKVNTERVAFHYGWRSHRSLRDCRHSFRAYAFVEISSGVLQCIGHGDSPHFTIRSQRRNPLETGSGTPRTDARAVWRSSKAEIAAQCPAKIKPHWRQRKLDLEHGGVGAKALSRGGSSGNIATKRRRMDSADRVFAAAAAGGSSVEPIMSWGMSASSLNAAVHFGGMSTGMERINFGKMSDAQFQDVKSVTGGAFQIFVTGGRAAKVKLDEVDEVDEVDEEDAAAALSGIFAGHGVGGPRVSE